MPRAKKPHILAIVGPTSSGKSELAVQLAKKMDGEIISVDSRQIYKGMNIGSGKITKKEMQGIPHWGLDLVSPNTQYSIANFQKYAHKTISNILARGKTPILCGGTAHWMDAVVYNQSIPKIKPNLTLRKKLEKTPLETLFLQLRSLDPRRAKTIDRKNPRRLIRALEIIISSGKPVPKQSQNSEYSVEWIGLNPEKSTLEEKIKKRLTARLKSGMIREVQTLHNNGVSWKRLEAFGLEYKFIALYLQGKLTKTELEDSLLRAILQFSKRQMTWWKRNKKITWYSKMTEPHINH